MMEIPGLLEGAHLGVGLGHQFLRHAERARLYLHLLDGLSEDPVADFRMVNHELAQWQAELVEKPQIIAVNKLDVTEVRERRPSLEQALRRAAAELRPRVPGWDTPIYFISAATGEGVDRLLLRTFKALDALPPANQDRIESLPEIPRSPPYHGGDKAGGVSAQRRGTTPPNLPLVRGGNSRTATATRPRARNLVRVEDGVYVVDSPDFERLVALADMDSQRVVLQLFREMTRRGVSKQLEDAGVQPGDTVRIGRVELEWF
jgi:GTP-binding protein